MEKEVVRKNVLKIFLFALAIALILWAYYSNLKFNLAQGLDAFSGATQM